MVGLLCFTEPGTGSDPKQITTTAVEGDHFVHNGTKRLYQMLPLKVYGAFRRDQESGKATAFIVEKFCEAIQYQSPGIR